jgi:hypothetical protein
MAIDTMTDGTVISTEFQKPRESPSQFRPVQAVAHALTQGSKVISSGGEKMLPEPDFRHAFQRGDYHHVEGIR